MTDRAEVYRWRKTNRWQHRRQYQLRCFPLCKMCLDEGRVTPATIADHVEPHRGDELKFFLGELQSLCSTHHESSKKRQERRGYSTQVGIDGWPIDSNHPVYTGKIPDPVQSKYTGERPYRRR